jgi:hypothetical protein
MVIYINEQRTHAVDKQAPISRTKLLESNQNGKEEGMWTMLVLRTLSFSKVTSASNSTARFDQTNGLVMFAESVV